MTKEKAQEFKNLGNLAFQSHQYDEAVKHFTDAINEDSSDHVLYSNRSGAYASLNKYEQALEDANTCVELKPEWVKGWSRKGLAEFNLGQLEQATESYTKGLELDPNNSACAEGLENAKHGMSNKFADTGFLMQMAQLLSKHPELSKYIREDPDYLRKMTNVAKDLAQNKDTSKIQELFRDNKDEGLKEGLAKLLGIDLPPSTGTTQSETPADSNQSTSPSQKGGEPQAPVSEAAELKRKGNEEYKKRNFDAAIELYQQAFKADPTEILYLNNEAAVYLEKEQYDKCIEVCQKALEIRYETKSDFSKVAKVYNRLAACYTRMGDYPKAIEHYKKSLCEDNNRHTRAALREVEDAQTKKIANDYVNPTLAEESRLEGNKYFKEHKYPEAKLAYDEAIKRNPADAKLYSNRAAAYMQLLEYPSALKDADKSIQLDPTFAKGWARKGGCHLAMKETHKALSAYQEGLKVDPNSEECKQGMAKTMAAIRQVNSSTEVDEERVQRALSDPEIQNILKDPQMQSILANLQGNPSLLSQYIQDPKIATAIEKLMAAGILRTG